MGQQLPPLGLKVGNSQQDSDWRTIADSRDANSPGMLLDELRDAWV
jgi:hypothetical protein